MIDKIAPPGNDAPAASTRQVMRQRPEHLDGLSPEATRRALHELQVHQIELEMQNEELRRAQQDLDAERARYFDHYNMAPVGYVTVNEQGLILQANLSAATLLGVARDTLVTRPVSSVILPADQDIYYLQRKRTIESGEPQSSELRMVNDGGPPFWVRLVSTAARDAAGAPELRLVLNDITERRQAEEALRESEERMRLATEAADIGVWDRDLKSNTLRWDERMFAIYGLPATPEGQVSHQDWQARVLPDDLPGQEARLQHTIASCGRDQREFRIVRASDHAVRFIQAAEMVIAGADGRAARVVGINLDITGRKRAEQEIGKLNSDLQRRAAELVAANKELEAFSYSVSHDLRAPLRAVDGFSRMVLKQQAGRLDDDGRRMLGVIHGETQRMGQLIDDLLSFSWLGRQQIQPAPIDMHALAREVFDELAVREPERKLRLDLQELPPASGTPEMIRQVWVNLIANAIKFTKERETGEIEIGTREDGEGGRDYYVKDNGAGFDMRSAGKLFGVFHRLHSQQEFPGTGVGLALVQRIVQRHGGRVRAEAEVDRGAAFYFTLPNQ